MAARRVQNYNAYVSHRSPSKTKPLAAQSMRKRCRKSSGNVPKAREVFTMSSAPFAPRALAVTLLCTFVSASRLTGIADAQPSAPSATALPSPGSTVALGTIEAKSVLAMRAQGSSPLISYNETFIPKGLGLRILQVHGKTVVHLAFSSATTPQTFQVTQHAGWNTTAILDTRSKQRYVAQRPFWSAVWSTVHHSKPTASPSPAQTTVLLSVRKKMIGDLLATSDKDYTVSFAGTQTLVGSPVYHLHFIARHDAAAHPLTDVFIDTHSYLVRRAVAAFSESTPASVTGTLTLNFGQVAGFWLVNSGKVAATVHAFFRQVSGSAAFSVSRVRTHG